MDEDEYKDLKEETLDQVLLIISCNHSSITMMLKLSEFQQSLGRLTKGEIGVIDNLGAMQLAIQAAVSQAFKTPEILRLFALAQPKHLRDKLAVIDRDFIVGKLDKDLFVQQKLEILQALIKLGESLTEEEQAYLDQNSSKSMNQFTNVQDNIVIKDGLVNTSK